MQNMQFMLGGHSSAMHWFIVKMCIMQETTAQTSIYLCPMQDQVDGRLCVCGRGFQGDDCSVNFDDCDLGLCENGATCIVRVSICINSHISIHSSYFGSVPPF